MDTEKTFIFRDQMIELSAAELSPDEVELAKQHVEITRHLQEIQQLYLMFQYALDCIDSKYTLMSNGKVLKNNDPANTEADFIAINAMVNNLISAGRTLVESMECYVSENYPKDDSNRKEYMDFYHKTYDISFPYRFLIRMRDYSQHGHLPVNQDGEWYGFDLYQVLNKPHFKHNGLIKQQLDNAVKEVMDVYGDIPRLSLAMTLAEFTANLLGMYYQFWVSVEPAMIISAIKFKELIVNHPENVNVVGDENVSLFIYDVDDDGVAHMVFTDDDTSQMMSMFKSEAKAVADRYMNSWHQLKQGTLIFRIVDKKQIEIDTI